MKFNLSNYGLTAGDTYGPSESDIFTAGIHFVHSQATEWGNRIECHGETEEAANALRDTVLQSLLAEKHAGALLEAVEALEEHLPGVPDANCSCHLSPPCNDCVEWSRLREALETISSIRKAAKAA
jgi:hypothetical protein